MEDQDYKFLQPKSSPTSETVMAVKVFVISTACIVITNENLYSSKFTHSGNSHCSTNIEHPVVCHNLAAQDASLKNEYIKKLFSLLVTLNRDGWDGYNATPIELKSYQNACKMVMEADDNILNLWNIFPSPNGTISFEYKERKIAALSVGNNNFSYIAIPESSKPYIGKKEFKATKAAKALLDMSKLFGYIG